METREKKEFFSKLIEKIQILCVLTVDINHICYYFRRVKGGKLQIRKIAHGQ